MADAKARAAALKEQGNAATAARKWARAKQLYSDALRLDDSNHTLWSNRSGVQLELGDAVAAEADAQKAIEHAPEWPKGYFRLGMALEAQGRHDEAAAAFSDGLSHDPGNADLQACRARAAGAAGAEEPALKAQGVPRRDGRPTLAEALAAARAVVDPTALPRVPRLGALVGERHGATLQLATEPHRGRYLRSARAVRPYELLATEHALFWCPPRCNDWGMTAPALHEAGPALKGAPPGSLEAWLLQLVPFHGAGGDAAGSSARPESQLPPLSLGELMLRVIQRNSHASAWSESHPDESTKYIPAVGLVCSLPNHSCSPSAAVSGVWDAKVGAIQLRLFATRPLEAGDEVTISYVPARLPPDVRRAHLLRNYGFACDCARCEAAFPGAAAGAPPGGPLAPLPVAVDDSVVYSCKACASGRVYAGAAACMDCGAPEPAASASSGGGAAATALLCSSPGGDWNRQRKAWLARADARSLEDVIKGADGCPLHPTDPTRIQLATAKLGGAMRLPSGEAGALAAQLLPALLAQPRLADAGLLVNCGHLLALGGRADEARTVYMTAAMRADAEYGASHALPQLYRALAAKPPVSASELGKVEARRRAAGDWVEGAGLARKTLTRWLEPVSLTAPLRPVPGGGQALGAADAAAMRELERGQIRALKNAYAPGVDVWAAE